MANNPFGGGDAYDDSDDDQSPLAGNRASAALELGGVGAQQMGGKIEQQYAQDVSTQKDQHEAPPPPSFCVNLCKWFPLRIFCFLGGVVLVTCTVLDFVFNGDAFIQFIIRIYLLFFGVIIMLIEAPTWTCTAWFQLRIFFWFRILSRTWGRAWFYLFITILCFGEFEQENAAEFTIVAGFYLMVIAFLSFIVSKTSATKYNRIFVYIVSGCEGMEVDAMLVQKFDLLTKASGENKLGSFELNKIAEEAGRVLSNAERHAIQTFLDESCNGYVSKEDWVKQFAKLKENKQRFL